MVRNGINFAIEVLMFKQIEIYTASLIIAFLCVASFCVIGPVNAASQENKIFLLELVNQIRTAPFSYAVALGYDTAFLEERGIFPDTAFEVYTIDEFLNSKALKNNDNVTGENTESLVPESVHLLTAETGGIISFKNFMPKNTAGKILVDYFFKKELDDNEFQYILSDTYYYAGFDMTSGIAEDGMNAWFFSISLGSLILKSEIQILNMINQVRSEPWTISSYVDRSLIEILSDNSAVIETSRVQYPPVFFNSSLDSSADDNLFYLQHGIYPEPLSITMSPLERSALRGYQGESVRKFGVPILYEKDDSAWSANDIFSYLMMNEIKPLQPPMVFASEFQDAGLEIFVTSGEDFDLLIFSLVTGSDVKNDEFEEGDVEEGDVEEDEGLTARVYGVLFSDNDGDTFYSAGEEIGKQTVTVYDEDLQEIKRVVSDNAGHFSVTLDSNKQYTFQAVLDTGPITEQLFISADQFVKLAYTPPPAL